MVVSIATRNTSNDSFLVTCNRKKITKIQHLLIPKIIKNIKLNKNNDKKTKIMQNKNTKKKKND
jgi:hypothetical protein